MAGLSSEAILKALSTMQHWGFESGELSRRFRFRDFADAFGFVAQAAALQQEMQHYGRVTQEGPISEQDVDLARKLSERASRAL